MEFIATYWYIWLVIMVIGYGYALSNQLRRMKGMMTSPFAAGIAENTFFKGIGKMVVAGAIGIGGMVLLAIAIVLNIINSAG